MDTLASSLQGINLPPINLLILQGADGNGTSISIPLGFEIRIFRKQGSGSMDPIRSWLSATYTWIFLLCVKMLCRTWTSPPKKNLYPVLAETLLGVLEDQGIYTIFWRFVLNTPTSKMTKNNSSFWTNHSTLYHKTRKDLDAHGSATKKITIVNPRFHSALFRISDWGPEPMGRGEWNLYFTPGCFFGSSKLSTLMQDFLRVWDILIQDLLAHDLPIPILVEFYFVKTRSYPSNSWA